MDGFVHQNFVPIHTGVDPRKLPDGFHNCFRNDGGERQLLTKLLLELRLFRISPKHEVGDVRLHK